MTGMPAHRSTEPRLPSALNGPHLSGEIATQLNTLVHELLYVEVELDAEAEAGRWLQATQVVDKVITTDLDAMVWWDAASGLRARAKRVLMPMAAGRLFGLCAVPECRRHPHRRRPDRHRLPQVRHLRHQGAAGGLPRRADRRPPHDHQRPRPRPDHHRWPRRHLRDRADLDPHPQRTQGPTAACTAPRTPRRRNTVARHPWPTPSTGLYRFADALALVARRETGVRLEGSAP